MSQALAECNKIAAPAKEIQEEKKLEQPVDVMDCEVTAVDNETDKALNCMETLEAQLLEALALESKYQPNLYLPVGTEEFGEITAGTRDGAAHVLRCLKVWYDMPSEVLFAAINLVDRFLTKMKVKPKHMACISVGSLYLANQQLSLPAMDPEDLVLISQCRCTAGDLTRMATIVADKLGAQPGCPPITALTFLRPLHAMFKQRALELGVLEPFQKVVTEEDLIMRLEIVACDSTCANVRPCELALVLLCTQLDSCVSQLESHTAQTMLKLVDFAIHMQKQCRIPDSSFFSCHGCVVNILSRYNNQDKSPHRQRLVWKLSSRTLKLLRPTDRLTSLLPTIDENGCLPRLRTGSVSSVDSEDTEDWPTSPLVPVCEQC